MVRKLKTFTRIPRVASKTSSSPSGQCYVALRSESGAVGLGTCIECQGMRPLEGYGGMLPRKLWNLESWNAISCTLREDVTIWMYFAQQLVDYFPYKSFSQTLGAVTQPPLPHPTLRFYACTHTLGLLKHAYQIVLQQQKYLWLICVSISI